MTEESDHVTTEAEEVPLVLPADREIGPSNTPDDGFYIIGIGASAGGLDAIRQFISQIPADFPHTLVIIQHISPDYKSVMSEILGRETSHNVVEVEDGVTVEPRHIYLIPPRANVVIKRTDPGAPATSSGPKMQFSLVDPTPRPKLNLPIDLFFTSLAEAAGDRAVAIVLSGTGSDGSRGLRSIKDHGGFIIVQSPETANFDGMPHAALATGIVDLTIAPEAMIKEILRYLEMRQSGVRNVNSLFTADENLFQRLLRLVSEYAEIDFTNYKEPTLKRRIARRVALSGCDSLQQYLEYIETHQTEVPLLHREFLVGVTNFFRDRPAWKVLEQNIVPEIFADETEDEPVKVWSVGCSTGEEAYSIAMMLEKWRQDHGILRDIRIIATDIKEESIRIARDGIYPESALDEIPEEYHSPNFLTAAGGTIKISEKIKNKIMFSQHNVVDHMPFINTELVICRNLLIYLTPELQSKLLTIFSFSLKPDGHLFLGAAETVARSDSVFAPAAERTRIFKNLGRERARIGFVNEIGLSFGQPKPKGQKLPALRKKSDDRMSGLFRGVLDRVDACVIIADEGGQVIETFGNYRAFLSLPDDAFTANLLDLVDERMRAAIALVLRRASSGNDNPETQVKFTDETHLRRIDVHCDEIAWESYGRAFAITLHNSKPIALMESSAEKEARDWSAADQSYVLKLEAELATAHEMLASSFEDLGAANEELQASNEELQAANEELQANNEEVQSVNEELHTVNAENVERISQIEAAYTDIQNLLDDNRVGKVLLDAQLKIRRFTSGFSRYVELQTHDIGRPLKNFSSRLRTGDYVRLLDAARRTSESGDTSTYEVQTDDGCWAIAHVRPFRSNTEEIEGAVLTLFDVTNIKSLEAELRSQRDLLEGMLESESSGYWDWRIVDGHANLSPSFKSMLGYAERELLDAPDAWTGLIHPDDLPAVQQRFEAHVAGHETASYDQEVRCLHKNGSIVWVIRRGRVVEWADDGAPLRMMGVHIDVTSLKRREEDVRRRAEEVRRFAFIAAHDLLQPMNTISNSVDVLKEELNQDLTQDSKKVLNFLTSATKRMGVRISGVLEYARLQDEEHALEPIDLQALWETCVEDLQPIIAKSQAKIKIGDMPCALGTHGLISRVMLNLLGNALKYVAPGTKPDIKIDMVPTDADFVAIRVSDNGIGIAPEDREKVFELFSRLHSDKDYEGNGLGLALCDRIVGQLGGKIWIEDASGPCTAVVFTLKASSDG
ncbi:MAG: chemotaxis protein CheB [Pseudomonadota bacterium]